MKKTAPNRRRGRPKKELAGYSQTRLTLVRAGVIALTEKGFSSSGIDEILTKVNVPKGSFYHYFPNKEAFGIELIDAYADYFSRKLNRFVSDEKYSPLDRLKRFIADASASMQKFNYSRGCLVGNLGQEMGSLPENYRQRLIAVFADWQRLTATCLKQGQVLGQISTDIDCDQLSEFFWIGWEGAVLRSKLERRAEPLDIFAKGFFQIIKP